MLGPITGLVLNYEVAANGDFIGQRDFDRLKNYSERGYLEANEKVPANKRASRQDAEQAMKALELTGSAAARSVPHRGARSWACGRALR